MFNRIRLLNESSASVDERSQQCIIEDWLNAVTNFEHYYHQVFTCISHPVSKQEVRKANTTYIGQCPVSQLVRLRKTMQEQLIKLTLDLDQAAKLRQPTSSKEYIKLRNHTRVLNHLNQQAQSRLYLVSQSRS
jgi:hypothetical protein